ncbi:MAG: C4-type zinc ribbon domain-containing protein, partial [Verrucomicrobiales bacterium]|nr:C4-type zinc ribbon domain-containing protein [Verrucomicrobiales bacterium]
MLEVIEKLLIVQDRDRKIQRVRAELANVGPEREALQNRLTGAQAALEAAKLATKQIESERKKLELEVEAKKLQIEKYSLQQFQTKKNEEYRALANEIENCRAAIVQLEDQQLELMEKAEVAQKEAGQAANAFSEAKRVVEKLVADLAQKDETLKRQLTEFEDNYDQLTVGIDEAALNRYQRLRRSKGDNAVVGIEHGVCGGCHMKLPVQIIRSCQGQQEIVSCPNCGRILYY